MKRRWIILGLLAAAVPLVLLGGRWYQRSAAATPAKASTPTTLIKRGDVVFTVTARGELQGGNSENLTAPMTGGNEMPITFLRQPGELVEAGGVVAEFDTTEQTFNLREAEADLAEAEQQVIQAQAESKAKEEEARYLLLQARMELRLAELEVRRNPLMAAIVARQNDLALESARDRVNQITRDLANRKATTEAGVAIQEAARNKAKVKGETARKAIESMTLRTKSGGYVSIGQNMNSNFWFPGLRFPMLQVGDTVRAGISVAQIPDLHSWEATARIGELDRGHLAPGQEAALTVVALPGRRFTAKVKNLGSTTGPPWDRHFDCRLTVDVPSPELRQGMTANVVITTERRRNVLWAPAQALFESDGRTYVFLQTPTGFAPTDVKLERRSESQVVLSGIREGQVVAMASPDQQQQKGKPAAGAMQALPKS